MGEDPLRRALLLLRLEEALPAAPSTRAAVDMALYDLLGRAVGLPAWKLLGGFRRSIPTSITIGILPISDTVEQARRYAGEGFAALKLKGGLDVEEDIQRLREVRKAVGEGVEIRFDANQGFTVEQAVHLVEQTRDMHLELLEQPVPRGQMQAMADVTRRVAVPVMADESLKTLLDTFRLARGDAVDMINVKLMKVGGIAQALHINSVARAAGMEVMVGCLDECALAISAGLAFALARPQVAYADLDGHIGLLGDPTAGAVILRQGVLYPQERPGFGVEPDEFG
jgi:L-alanine-DL-glutamate epimerase-like enolase superfamily enzyme